MLVQQDSISRQQLDTQAAPVRQFEATVKTDQAQVDSAKLQLTYCRITAPITGTVGLRLVDPGNIVHATDPNGLVVITQLQPITVVFTHPRRTTCRRCCSRLRPGEPLAGRGLRPRQARPSSPPARCSTVDNQIDPTTGTVKLKAVFANADGALFPNQFVNARLLVDTLRGRVARARRRPIQRGPQGTFVYVVKPDQTVDAAPRRASARPRATTRRSRSGRRARRDGRRRRRRQAAAGREGDVDARRPARPRERRRPATAGSGARRGRPAAHEPVPPVHPAAGRDLAADGRPSCSPASSAYRQLPVSALPQVDYPTIQVVTLLSRARAPT